MTQEDEQNLQGVVESEGFDYAFRYYSDFSEIKDPTFHELRKSYVAAAKVLSEYIGLEEE